MKNLILTVLIAFAASVVFGGGGQSRDPLVSVAQALSGPGWMPERFDVRIFVCLGHHGGGLLGIGSLSGACPVILRKAKEHSSCWI